MNICQGQVWNLPCLGLACDFFSFDVLILRCDANSLVNQTFESPQDRKTMTPQYNAGMGLRLCQCSSGKRMSAMSRQHLARQGELLPLTLTPLRASRSGPGPRSARLRCTCCRYPHLSSAAPRGLGEEET